MKDANDNFYDECGLMGIWNHPEAANLCYLGLYAQQHRGQEGAGVVAVDRNEETPRFSVYKNLGLVQEVFKDFDFTKLPGDVAIGHVRYTTAGSNQIANVQPFFSEISVGPAALAHNGNLINADRLKKELISKGAIFNGESDSELFMHLLARGNRNDILTETVIESLKIVKGAYSLILLFKDRMLGIRDPAGLRPLCLGKLDDGWVLASETCALDLLGADYVRDVEPGEIVEIIGDNEPKSYFPFGVVKPSPCIFEFVYLARPDSNVFGKNVYGVRKRMGAELAKEHPIEADMVVPVPDSGVTAAIGYSQESGIPMELGLIRNHYIGRTFIEPEQSIRDFGVKIKLNGNPDLLRGKKIIVVDDSIVRGTTSRKIIAMMRRAGAKEIHVRVSSPPTTGPCYYGIDTPSKEELIASSNSVEAIREFIGADTLGYLSQEGLQLAVDEGGKSYCSACFSGVYPLGTPKTADGISQLAMFKEEKI